MPTTMKPVDAVIVGFGWTGAIMAMELAQAGLNVVALERGGPANTVPNWAYPKVVDEIAQSVRHGLLQDLSVSTVTIRHSRDERAAPYRQIGSFKPGTGVGGAGIHWSGVHSRVMPEELRFRSHITERYGASFIPADMQLQDWPVSYDDLEPHFDRFEYVCGTAGEAGNIGGVRTGGGNPFEAPRARGFPLPPLADPPTASLFAKATRELGYHPYALPAANASRAYTNPYGCQLGPCNFCGFCSDYGCINYSKASPQTTILPALFRMPNFTLRTDAHVLKVNVDDTGRRATGVVYVDAQGREVEQPAALVVLAAFHLHNVRLMLSSAIGTPYDPVTGQGTVGRNFCYQLINSVNLFFDKSIYINQFMGAGGVGRAIDDFYGDNFDHAQAGFIGGGVMWGRQTGNGPVRGIPLPPGTPHWGSGWKQGVRDHYLHSGRIEAQMSNMAYRGCYLDLDPVYRDAYGTPLLRMTLNWQDNELRMSEFFGQKLSQIGRAMGAQAMSGRILKRGDNWDTRPYQSTHINGGTAMGADPRTSVVNRYLQSWDVPNLFVLGANVFPHGVGYNPTGLVGALTYWAAAGIRSIYLKNPGPMVST
ncbi:GMC family oxidoreductase [Gluconacetobacter tumulisoli]|uniref:GMC family oxidoreductase n=1 Tax=Gluconacetobacter tumulisoli TaxID=1286189 RepID=A0A7W4K955_9PROT|nr:GMC family oxidoreductase [Gluconacetobacter tumulisoli]MBB2202625.1 GMC family oxidoreductase [Gluconacetobacter tumulisoli]